MELETKGKQKKRGVQGEAGRKRVHRLLVSAYNDDDDDERVVKNEIHDKLRADITHLAVQYLRTPTPPPTWSTVRLGSI